MTAALTATPLYAGILGIAYIVLTVRVVGARKAARVALGDGGDRVLQRRCRAHGNFIEYVPLTVILMALAELQGAPVLLVHAMGLAIVTGRLAHASAICREPEPMLYRQIGMILTLAALATAALTDIVLAAAGLI